MTFFSSVLETEWWIASAGGEIFDLPYGVATRDCNWADFPLSHLAVVEDLRAFDPEHPIVCDHSYELIFPNGGDGLLETHGARREVALLKDPLPDPPKSEYLVLQRVENEADWNLLAEARVQVEAAFRVAPQTARQMVDHIRYRRRYLDGDWYLAYSSGVVVGEIGLVTFEVDSGRLGRLQDVDILPAFQGRGLGDELISTVSREARRLGCDALCLRADADDWPKDWYAKLGFVEVGEWLRLKMPPVR